VPQHPLGYARIARPHHPLVLPSTAPASLPTPTHRNLKAHTPRERLHLVQAQFDGPLALGALARRVLKMPQQRAEVDPHPSGLEQVVYDPQETQDVARLLSATPLGTRLSKYRGTHAVDEEARGDGGPLPLLFVPAVHLLKVASDEAELAFRARERLGGDDVGHEYLLQQVVLC